MGGGQSQAETWDPKPGGARPIETSVPGISISEHLPRCAAEMKRLSIIRSMAVESADPGRATERMHTGWEPYPRASFAAFGTILAYESGKKGFALPKHVTIDAPQVPTTRAFADEDLPFAIRDAGRPVPAAPGRGERERLLADLNATWAKPREPVAAADALLSTPLLKAFDLSGEPEALRKGYGGDFGRNCLLARRLVEAGCPFVEVGLNGWEDDAKTKALCGELDPALAILVRDLAERDLLKDTVVACLGPFGRSPLRLEGKGRAPWTRGWSAVLAGGPLAGGRVHGDTGPEGKDCAKPVPPPVFFSTLYKACGIERGKYAADGHTWTYVRQWPKPLLDLF
jgi:hypothetical protein